MERATNGPVRVDQAGALERILEISGTAFLLGGIDTGKTSFALELLDRAARSGRRCALVDSNIDQSAVGPPTTCGLKLIEPGSEVSLDSVRTADALSFVGSLSPREHLLPLVVGTQKLVTRARSEGAELIAQPGSWYPVLTVEEVAQIARDLFIYVNAERAANSRLLTEFVDFYLHDAIDAVPEVGYVSLSDPDPLLPLPLSEPDPDPEHGTVPSVPRRTRPDEKRKGEATTVLEPGWSRPCVKSHVTERGGASLRVPY